MEYMMIVMIVTGISTQEVAVNTLTMFKMGLEGRGFRDMMIPLYDYMAQHHHDYDHDDTGNVGDLGDNVDQF